jgi:hypothetical protein
VRVFLCSYVAKGLQGRYKHSQEAKEAVKGRRGGGEGREGGRSRGRGDRMIKGGRAGAVWGGGTERGGGGA